MKLGPERRIKMNNPLITVALIIFLVFTLSSLFMGLDKTLRILSNTLFFIALLFCALFAGQLIDNSTAIKALESQGYSNITIVNKAWVAVQFRGCGAGDAARFDTVAINPIGQKVDTVYICSGWIFKGSTLRTW